MAFPRFAAMVLVVAVVCAEAALEQPASNGQPLLLPPGQLAAEGNELYKAGRWDGAAGKYEAVLAKQPDLWETYFFLGHSYLQLQKPALATKPLLVAADRDPDPKIRKLALEYLVSAYGARGLNDTAATIGVLQRLIALEPTEPKHYSALGKVYEDARRHDDAESVLVQACAFAPADPVLLRQLAGFYNRRGRFAKVMEALDSAAALEPGKPEGHQLIATYYWDKAYKDRRLPRERKLDYVHKGIAAADRALALEPDYVDALTFKNLLLRLRADEELDLAARASIYAEADELRNRAIDLNKERGRRQRPRQVPPLTR